jgi:hypothetical protein
MIYIIIPKEFAEQNFGHQIGANRFGYAVTLSGLYVTSVNSKIEFPELFVGKDFPQQDFSMEDFPQQVNE